IAEARIGPTLKTQPHGCAIIPRIKPDRHPLPQGIKFTFTVENLHLAVFYTKLTLPPMPTGGLSRWWPDH
ncbi:hypothetical protein, partial [Enterobacter intestinihominis]